MGLKSGILPDKAVGSAGVHGNQVTLDLDRLRAVCSLSGGELFDRIAAEDYKMTEGEVINYVRQVCDGLRHMHERNIVHLDIKVSLTHTKPHPLSQAEIQKLEIVY